MKDDGGLIAIAVMSLVLIAFLVYSDKAETRDAAFTKTCNDQNKVVRRIDNVLQCVGEKSK